MANRQLCILFLVLACLPSFSFGKWTSDFAALRAEFQRIISSGDFPSVPLFLQRFGGPHSFTDYTDASLCLYFEGTLKGWVTLAEKPVIKEKNQSLVLTVYGEDNGAAFAVAKERAEVGEKVTMLLLPSCSGARGTRGVMQGIINKHYEKLENWLRKWNDKSGKRIKFVTILDVDTNFSKFSADRSVFEHAEKKLFELALFMDKIKLIYIAAKGNENYENYNAAVEVFKKKHAKYYTPLGFPIGDLEQEMRKVITAVLSSLFRENDYSYCFEEHSGQAFQTVFGTSFSEPIVKFLNDLKRNGVHMISIDSILEISSNGLQHEIEQYEPHMSIVIYMPPSIGAKVEDEYKLKNVQILQIDWNFFCEPMFGADVAQTMKYSVAPDIITVETKLVSKPRLDIQYRVLKSMVDFKSDWDVAVKVA